MSTVHLVNTYHMMTRLKRCIVNEVHTRLRKRYKDLSFRACWNGNLFTLLTTHAVREGLGIDVNLQDEFCSVI